MKHRGHQTVKKGCRPQKQHKSRKRMARYRFFSLYFFKTRLALAWSAFCFLRRAPLTVSTDKAIRAPSFFRQDRAAIGIVTLRSPCVKHASVGCRAAHLRDWPKSFDRKREDFFVWKVEERRHTGVWQGMRQTKRENIPFQERCCPNRFVRAYRGALLVPAAFQTASERVKT